MFVNGNVKVTGGKQSLTLVSTGQVVISGNVNLTSARNNLAVLALGQISIEGNANINGIVYSLNENVKDSGNATVNGAIAAGQDIIISGQAQVRDLLPPPVPVVNNLPLLTNSSTVTISGFAEPYAQVIINDQQKELIRIYSDSLGNFSSNLAFLEGWHYLQALAVDSNGNRSQPSLEQKLFVDLTPPVVKFLTPSENALISSTTTVEASATDNYKVKEVKFYLSEKLLGEVSAEPYRLDFDTSIYDNGKYRLKAVAKDEAGNQSQTEIPVEIANNIVTPFGGSIISPDGMIRLDFPAGAVAEPTLIKYTRFDETPTLPPFSSGGLGGFSYANNFFSLTAETLSGQPVYFFNLPFLITVNQVPDVSKLSLYSFSSLNNWWELIDSNKVENKLSAAVAYVGTFALLADILPPQTLASLSSTEAASGWHLSDTTVFLEPTDYGSGVKTLFYAWDETSTFNKTNSKVELKAPEGNHTLNYYSEDKAGNIEALKKLIIKVDSQKPSLKLITPDPGSLTPAEPINIEASTEDSASGVKEVAFYINNNLVFKDSEAPYIYSLNPFDLNEGTYTLEVVVLDNAGWTNNLTTQITIEGKVITPEGTSFTTNDNLLMINFPAGAVRERTVIKYTRVSDSSTIPPIEGFSSGVNFFTLEAFDRQGAVYNFLKPFTITVNEVPPVPNLSLYYFDTAKNDWQVVASVITNGRLTATLDHLTLFGLLSDTVPPLITNNSPTEVVNSYTPLITANITDKGIGVDTASISLKLDGVSVIPTYDQESDLLSYLSSTLSMGKHIVQLSVKDKYGNQSYLSWSFVVFGTPVGGNISRDTTWTEDNSPYIVTSDILIFGWDRRASLTIKPNVTVKFNPGTGIQVGYGGGYWSASGALIAQGTPDKPITFTSNSTNPQLGDWKGIYFFYRAGYGTLTNTIIEYGGYTNRANVSANIYADSGSSISITNSKIRKSSGYGLYLVNSISTIKQNNISFNKQGFYINQGSALIYSNIISDNQTYGITAIYPSSNVVISNNQFLNNGSFPIILTAQTMANLSNNIYSGNAVNAISFTTNSVTGDAVWYYDAVPYIITSDIWVLGMSGWNFLSRRLPLLSCLA